MNYNQQDKVDKLIGFLKNCHSKETIIYRDIKATDADVLWNASKFWGKVINECNAPSYYISYKKFLNLRAKYERKNYVKVDIDLIFGKFWLRNVLGFIKIPRNISSALYQFNNIRDFKNEFEFLIDIKEIFKEPLEKDKFQQLVTDFEENKLIKLNFESLHLFSEKDGKISITHIREYYQHLIENWAEFEFLAYLYEKKAGQEYLQINGTKFNNLYKKHQALNVELPSINELIDQKVLIKKYRHYLVNFNNSEIEIWRELGSKISGYYWENLISQKFNSDIERLRTWITMCLNYTFWPEHFLKYVTETSREKFLDASYQLLIHEKDIEGIDSEFLKIRLDHTGNHDRITYTKLELQEYELTGEDLFDLLESIEYCEGKSHQTYFHDQHTRTDISFLISIIVMYDKAVVREDKEGAFKLGYFKRILSLLETSNMKPFLLWRLSFCISKYRPEVIPLMLIDDQFKGYSFHLLNKINFTIECRDFLVKELWKKATSLALEEVPRSNSDTKQAAKLIFQIYLLLNKEKYNTQYYGDDRKEINPTIIKEKEMEVLSIIENSPLFNHDVHRQDHKEFLMPRVFKQLSNLFIDLEIRPLYLNGSVSFPMLKWDGIIWLIKLSQNWKYKYHFQNNKDEINILPSTFLKSYLEIMETNTVDNLYNQDGPDNSVPVWSEYLERLEYLEWVYLVYALYRENNLNQFLSPRFTFLSTDETYNRNNEFNAKKLRTHIGVLLQVLKSLLLRNIPSGAKSEEIEEIKDSIESSIIGYLKIHTVDIPPEARVDLFQHYRESGFSQNFNEALLPQIARALNWFKQRGKIIEIIIGLKDIEKVVTILQWITSEGIRQSLIHEVNKFDIISFLETPKAIWVPMDSILRKISKYTEFEEQIKQIITHLKVNNKNGKYNDQLFHSELLLAYYRKDEKAIEELEEPKNNRPASRYDYKFDDYKRFYIALIKIYKEPDTAYSMFNSLVLEYPLDSASALNRMIAKINLSDKENNLEALWEALEEWEEYSKNLTQDKFDNLEPVLSIQKLYIYRKIRDYRKSDEAFNDLELPTRMLPEVLEIRIECLLEQDKRDEAFNLILAAEDYHKFSESKNIEFIYDLKAKTNGVDDIELLQHQYYRIFNSDINKLIKILPENFNGMSIFNEFITKEVVLAADKMLDKIHSIEAIKNENKYSDLLQLALSGRIGYLGLSVKDQTRKAFSPEEKDLGEIDLDIQDINSRSLITCEAFILRDKPRIQGHLNKVMTHYTHKRDGIIILVYYIGDEATFEIKWKEYCESIIPFLDYPGSTYKSLVDKTRVYGYDNTGIKISHSNYESTTSSSKTTLYHIFVNINYIKK